MRTTQNSSSKFHGLEKDFKNHSLFTFVLGTNIYLHYICIMYIFFVAWAGLKLLGSKNHPILASQIKIHILMFCKWESPVFLCREVLEIH